MEETKVLETIINIMENELDLEDVTEESSLLNDLEMSSLEVFSLFSDLEAVFDVSISERTIRNSNINTVADIKELVMSRMKSE